MKMALLLALVQAVSNQTQLLSLFLLCVYTFIVVVSFVFLFYFDCFVELGSLIFYMDGLQHFGDDDEEKSIETRDETRDKRRKFHSTLF